MVSALFILLFWIAGLVMIVLNYAGITSVANWIVSASFWGPYAILFTILTAILLKDAVLHRRSNVKQ